MCVREKEKKLMIETNNEFNLFQKLLLIIINLVVCVFYLWPMCVCAGARNVSTLLGSSSGRAGTRKKTGVDAERSREREM